MRPPLRSKRTRTVKAKVAEYLASLCKEASRGHNPEVFRDDHCLASTSAMESHPVSKKVTKSLLTFKRQRAVYNLIFCAGLKKVAGPPVENEMSSTDEDSEYDDEITILQDITFE